MREPTPGRPFTEPARGSAGADLRGPLCVFVGGVSLTLEDQQQGRTAEHVAFESLDRALQPARVSQGPARRDAEEMGSARAAIFGGFLGV
jgi:hypothetical protein